MQALIDLIFVNCYFQACTEMVMPICATGKTDMFEPESWNFTEFASACHKRYGVNPRENDARIMYGGTQIQAASNIVFSNGLLDPWTAGKLSSFITYLGSENHNELLSSQRDHEDDQNSSRATLIKVIVIDSLS